MRIDETDAPANSLIAAYATREGHYTDCFETDVSPDVTLADMIKAFYTQPLFRAERLVLRLLARAASTDAEVADLAAGRVDRFAVWQVAGRTDTEVLMKDRSGRTLSWLQIEGGLMRFGSVVVPVRGRGGTLMLGPVFHSLLGAHKVYSRALLSGAARRVPKGGSGTAP